MKKFPKLLILFSILFILFVITLIACSPSGNTTSEVRQADVEKGDLIVTVTGNGNIETALEATLSSGTAGKLEKIFVQEGDTVKKGDALAQLETDALQLALTEAIVNHGKSLVAVKEAEINLKNAKIALEKAQDKYKWPELEVAEADVEEAQTNLQYALDHAAEEGGNWNALVQRYQAILEIAERKLDAMLIGASPDEVEVQQLLVEAAQESLSLSESSLNLAQQSLDYAQKQLDEAMIIAPFDGIVASIDAKEGDTINGASTIVHLVDTQALELIVEIDEMDIPYVEPNQEVIINFDALPSANFQGTVITIYPLPTEGTGLVMYNVKITLEFSGESDIKVGMRAIADIIIDKKTDILKIPSQAIKLDDSGRQIVQVIVDNKLQERVVMTGISNDSETEITSGLSENEIVAY